MKADIGLAVTNAVVNDDPKGKAVLVKSDDLSHFFRFSVSAQRND